MKYFKIKIGFDNHEFISIDETELEAAIYCSLSESKGVFNRGIVRGKDIISITEDWHKEMGWNPTHVMEDEDWAVLRKKGITKKYEGTITSVKEKVKYLIETNKANLIGKGFEIPKKENKELPINEMTKKLSDKMTIK